LATALKKAAESLKNKGLLDIWITKDLPIDKTPTQSRHDIYKTRSAKINFLSRRKFLVLRRLLDGRALSIKKLTLLGFSLVSLPLVLALIYSATQVNQLANQGTQAIYSVAELTNINQELNDRRLQLERYASQYVVLKDKELKLNYVAQYHKITELLDHQLTPHVDNSFNELRSLFNQRIQLIDNLINDQAINEQSLEALQAHFVELASLSKQINIYSNKLISVQATSIKTGAEQVSRTMLISLVIIPVTLVIAGFFIFLITSPLKLLIRKIKYLEQGDFEKAIHVKSSPEIREIADALEMMRLRLHALELQKSSFIRHISHELKTPLAAIREGTELIYDNSVGPLNDEQQEICLIIRESVNRLQRHIEELLDFNIVLDSTSLQDSEKITLPSLIDGVITDHKLDLKRKQITINNTIGDVTIYSNTKQLKVILDNIISNAIKYTKTSGTISISGTINEEHLTLNIVDQGPGISDDMKERVFEAFYQGPAPIESQVKGSGLGLTIVKELLMRLNGEIIIKDSDGQHCGANIEITLPRVSRYED